MTEHENIVAISPDPDGRSYEVSFANRFVVRGFDDHNKAEMFVIRLLLVLYKASEK